MSSAGKASVRPLELPLGDPGDEAVTGTRGEDAPVEETDLLERVLEPGEPPARAPPGQTQPGRPRDRRDDRGRPGSVPEDTLADDPGRLAGGHLRPPARAADGNPEAGGGTRNLGIPTVLDRFIEQALLQVLQEEWDPTFSERSYGFRPQRSAHQAVGQAQAYIREGDTWVVDLDLEKFFDRVNHDVLLSRVRRRVQDRRVLTLIHRFLKAGVLTLEGSVEPTAEGTPPGGPLLAPAGEPAAGRARQGAGEARAPVRPLRRRCEHLRAESAGGGTGDGAV